MVRTSLILASVFALTAVILGAFGAHALKGLLESVQLTAYETGVRYQFYHAMALFVVGILGRDSGQKHHGKNAHHDKYLSVASWCFILGIFLFSGSLYLLACRDILSIAGWNWLGPITPLGGLFFILGWVFVLVSQIRK